ncbi:Non-specific lipid-transfer protein A [Ananas comosus]|uniref:Non-specific lipid-transfer protein n=1 Tax=Ananas comosus TaxID=4615 RepID=A0A199UY75_ANACO|nr:Non-specific lipid-transfer protein A [Ananas comosus]
MRRALATLVMAAAAAYVMAEPAQALSCGDVSSNLAQCVKYLTGQQARPTGPCCGGVRRLKAMAATTADRRLACNCMRSAASRMKSLRYDLVNALPRQCAVPLNFFIDLNKCNQ